MTENSHTGVKCYERDRRRITCPELRATFADYGNVTGARKEIVLTTNGIEAALHEQQQKPS